MECPSIADRVQIGSRRALALMHEMYEQYHNAPRARQSGRKRRQTKRFRLVPARDALAAAASDSAKIARAPCITLELSRGVSA